MVCINVTYYDFKCTLEIMNLKQNIKQQLHKHECYNYNRCIPN
jgi:hypothetical protein